MIYNYSTLKQLGKETRTPVANLLALARQHDPFYFGTPSDLDKAFSRVMHEGLAMYQRGTGWTLKDAGRNALTSAEDSARGARKWLKIGHPPHPCIERSKA